MAHPRFVLRACTSTRFASLIFALSCLLGALLLAPSCGRNSAQQGLDLTSTASQSVAPADLGQTLQHELQRLGKDNGRTALAAPSAGNAVFDLSASLIDSDGDGPLPATGVELSWTERLLGDYDSNGLVTAADLTPLGLNFGRSVGYLKASAVGGIEWWPSDDPTADGYGDTVGFPPPPPKAGSGAANWQLARVDGNFDGLIGVQDVTTIAAHWRERLDGYRIYRRSPGSSDFELLHDPGDPFSALTVERDSADNSFPGALRPVRYHFSQALASPGEYEYYVAAFDRQSGSEGPASAPVKPMLNHAPEAQISASTQLGPAPLVVDFSAAASTDADGDNLSYQWDLDGDGVFELDSGADVDVSHTYTSEGSYIVTLLVSDSSGAKSVASLPIGVGVDLVASFKVTPPEAAAPQQLFFDPSASIASLPIVSYHWIIEDPLSPVDIALPAPGSLSHLFLNPGGYSVFLELSDSGGGTAQISYNVELASGPIAALTATPSSTPVALPVQLDASGSTVNQPASYAWEPLGDGNIVEVTSTPIYQFFYDLPGEYQARVHIIDAEQHSATASATVLVGEVPVASFSVTRDPDHLAPDTVTFDPAASSYATASASFRWDFDGNGSVDLISDGLGTVSHKYLTAGDYNARLEIVDEIGLSDEFVKTISFDAGIAPTVTLSADYTTGYAPLAVTFTAQVSDDQGGWSLSWDLDGDGIFEGDNSNQTTKVYVYPAAETTTAAVKVTDKHGLTGQAGQTITVLERPVQARFSYLHDPTDPDGRLRFDASASSSSSGAIISYAWDWDNDGFFDESSAVPVVQHDFTPGLHTVGLKVADSQLNTATLVRQVSTTPLSLLVVRDDAGQYPASLTALEADLDSMGLGWEERDFAPTLNSDISSTPYSAVVWYRGGPGAAGEPSPGAAAWTDAEIDSLIQLLADGNNVLLFAQNLGLSDNTFAPFAQCWESIYGGTLVSPALGSGPPFGSPDRRRLPWAAGLATDGASGFGGQIGYFPWAPTSVVADVGAHDSHFWTYCAERESGGHGSGYQISSISWPPDSQFCSVGFYDPTFSNFEATGNGLGMGLSVSPRANGFDIAFLSWGNMRAPDHDIGSYPNWSHNYGPSRFWIVGYPWATLSITDSEPAGMTRAQLLLNILAWLDKDDEKIVLP